MKTRTLLMAFVCLTFPSLLFSQAPDKAVPSFALKSARLFDGKSDSPISNAVILVTGNKISAVGSGLAIPKGSEVLDLGDVTLLPGLIDAHTHLLSEMDGTNLTLQDVEMLRIVSTQSTAQRALLGAKLGREDLLSGITTVRDLGNSGVNGDVALRDAIEDGWLPGPRILPSTRALAPPGGQFGKLIPEAQSIIEQEYVTIRGAESARQAVRQALYDGAGCIKVIVNGSPASVTAEEMKAIVDEAHRSRVKVAAHAIGDAATRIAAEAGADSIEHAYVVPDDVLKLMAEKKIFLVPTDGTVRTFLDMSFGTRTPTEEERRQFEGNFSRFVKQEQERLQRAIKFGVPIAAGSDMYLTMPKQTRGQASLDVIDAYAESGMTSQQIIRAFTSAAAELLGWQDRVGTLESGKLADIIAVPGDATRDYKSLQKVSFVMKDGKIVKRPNEGSPAALP